MFGNGLSVFLKDSCIGNLVLNVAVLKGSMALLKGRPVGRWLGHWEHCPWKGLRFSGDFELDVSRVSCYNRAPPHSMAPCFSTLSLSALAIVNTIHHYDTITTRSSAEPN